MRRCGGRARRARLAIGALAGCMLALASPASAEPDGTSLSRAHDAYARGAAAYALGDYARAARELATADALVPDAVTLRAALDAVTLADDPILGADLLARATRDPGDAALAHAAAVAATRFAHRTGTLVVHCDDCLALIDGAPARIAAPNPVLPGVHTVTVQRQRAPENRIVDVPADETREIVVRARDVAPPVPAPIPSSGAHDAPGASPVWFFAAAATAAALAGATIWSGVDTANDHATFTSERCAELGSSACANLASTGRGDEVRTAVLGVATGVTVAGAVVLGVLAIRWRGSPRGSATVGVGGTGASLRIAF